MDAKEFLESKGIKLPATTLISYIDGAMRQPDLVMLLEDYAMLKYNEPEEEQDCGYKYIMYSVRIKEGASPYQKKYVINLLKHQSDSDLEYTIEHDDFKLWELARELGHYQVDRISIQSPSFLKLWDKKYPMFTYNTKTINGNDLLGCIHLLSYKQQVKDVVELNGVVDASKEIFISLERHETYTIGIRYKEIKQ